MPINKQLLDELRKRQQGEGLQLPEVMTQPLSDSSATPYDAHQFASVDERDAYDNAQREAQQPTQEPQTQDIPPSVKDTSWTNDVWNMIKPQADEPNMSVGNPASIESMQPQSQSFQVGSGRAPQGAQQQPQQTGDQQNPDDYRKKLLDQLRTRYGLNDEAALKQAQENQRKQQAMAMMQEGFATMGSALSRGTVDVDHDFYKRLGATGEQGVKNVLELRKARQEGLANEGNLSAMVDKQEAADPNSPLNKGFRDFMVKAIPAFKDNPNIGAITVNNPALEKMANVYMQTEAKKATAALTRELALRRADQGDDRLNLRRQQIDYQNSANATKELMKDKEYTQAQEGLSSAKKALDTLELAKTDPIAYGGKAIETARAFVGNGRLNQTEINSLGGSKAIGDRLEQMFQEAAHGTITPNNYKYYKQLISTVQAAEQRRLDAVIQRHSQAYGQHKGLSNDSARTQLLGSNDNSIAGSPSQQPQQQLSNDDQQAIEWAQNNPGDPRAAKILQMHGIK